jgi:Ca-activated chloride channel family protein
MSRSKFTYRIGLILKVALAWEVLFWSLFFFIISFLDSRGNESTLNHLAFKYPNLLWLNLLVLPIGGLFFKNLVDINKIAATIKPKLQHYFLLPISDFQTFIRFFFFRNAIVFLIIALSIPIYGNKKVVGSTDTMELVVAIDISNSMNTRDIDRNISRLEISKRALIQLVNNLHGQRLGITVFAGGAYVQLPLTNDYFAAKMFINEIQTNMISNQGTNIAQALTTSVRMFSKLNATKGIILVTDGENHEENPNEILNKITKENIQLCVLGLGTESGGLVPNQPNRPELGYKTDNYGQNIVSKVNPKFIKEIAEKAKGYSIVCDTPFPNLTDLLSQINRMKRTKVDGLEFNVKETKYQYPLFLALFFILLYLVGTDLRFDWLNKLVKRK